MKKYFYYVWGRSSTNKNNSWTVIYGKTNEWYILYSFPLGQVYTSSDTCTYIYFDREAKVLSRGGRAVGELRFDKDCYQWEEYDTLDELLKEHFVDLL